MVTWDIERGLINGLRTIPTTAGMDSFIPGGALADTPASLTPTANLNCPFHTAHLVTPTLVSLNIPQICAQLHARTLLTLYVAPKFTRLLFS